MPDVVQVYVTKLILYISTSRTIHLNGAVMSGVIDADIEKKMSPGVVEEWLVVNGLPTYVIKLGALRSDLPLVLILPGQYT